MGIRYLEEKPKKSENKIRYLDNAQKQVDAFLPGADSTEKKINQREDILGNLVTRLNKQTPLDALKRNITPGKNLLDPLGLVMGVTQRAEAAVANPLMVMQEEARGNNVMEKIVNRKIDESTAIISGIMGKRLGEFGDVPRRAGWPEPVSALIGLGSMSGLLNVLSSGRLTGKATELVKNKTPRIMSQDYLLDRAEKSIKLLDGTKTALGQQIRSAVKEVAEEIVDIPKLNKNLKPLPKNVINALDDPIHEIKKVLVKGDKKQAFLGKYRPTIENMQKVQEALDDFMTTKDWIDASSKAKRNISMVYKAVSNAMKNKAPNLIEPKTNYSNFMRVYRKVGKTLKDTSGNILEGRMRKSLIKNADNRSKIKAWETMSEFVPELKQIMKDVGKYNSRLGTKKNLLKMSNTALRWGVGYGLLRKFVD